jgi:hypothetical protein
LAQQQQQQHHTVRRDPFSTPYKLQFQLFSVAAMEAQHIEPQNQRRKDHTPKTYSEWHLRPAKTQAGWRETGLTSPD